MCISKMAESSPFKNTTINSYDRPQTVDKVGAGDSLQHHFSIKDNFSLFAFTVSIMQSFLAYHTHIPYNVLGDCQAP